MVEYTAGENPTICKGQSGIWFEQCGQVESKHLIRLERGTALACDKALEARNVGR